MYITMSIMLSDVKWKWLYDIIELGIFGVWKKGM